MSQYCEVRKLLENNINTKINAKDIVNECLQAFKRINDSIFIEIPKKQNNNNDNNKNNVVQEEETIEKHELKHIGIRTLLYYATPENKIATADLYQNYSIIEPIPETYFNFISNHQMFEPLRNATDYRFLEIHGDTSETCLSIIKVRVYFNTLDFNKNQTKTSIDYKFIIQRIFMPERKLNYDWRVASITII
jgi:hypothetical protein